eukprot:2676268-Amphidinium_carterae.1
MVPCMACIVSCGFAYCLRSVSNEIVSALGTLVLLGQRDMALGGVIAQIGVSKTGTERNRNGPKNTAPVWDLHTWMEAMGTNAPKH